jgi:hypothetical protein
MGLVPLASLVVLFFLYILVMCYTHLLDTYTLRPPLTQTDSKMAAQTHANAKREEETQTWSTLDH